MSAKILQRPLVVASACLLGRSVRYDGGHTRADFVTDRLSQHVNLRAVCPEVGAGMTTPREAVRLVVGEGGIEMRGQKSAEDWTARINGFTDDSVASLKRAPVVGFILKRGSPSCGVFGVRRYNAEGKRLPSNAGGLYAERIRAEYPHLPVEEEGRLNDPALRHHFLTRVFAGHRAEVLRASATGIRDLMAFHRSEKLLLMAHNPNAQRQLGRLIGQWDGELGELIDEYVDGFHAALRRPTHRGLVINALQHMAGYLRDVADEFSRRELNDAIARFEARVSDDSAARTLLRHHIRTHGISYLADQTILAPYPEELRVDLHAPHVPERGDRVRRVRSAAV